MTDKGSCGSIAVMQLSKTLPRGIKKERVRQVKLTIIINDRLSGIIPQQVLIPGETQVHELGAAITKALNEQSVYGSSSIMKVILGNDEVYHET